ncbi:T9SS type A sorting domain-containing protein [Lacinutrix neustonica]|uniref:T9SS type A sorting domain-containing protein n=1 Tax=Lacinutrix neustonica TaxID=2980107 RepID=A0A9E8MXP6_9FLAO|nr:T9SS type A sorting domain-containing protein [Lacinutrix neustonica]WAC02457.1 T9SS type A sorting domain-containing protein [Lacinutrix neustonica]
MYGTEDEDGLTILMTPNPTRDQFSLSVSHMNSKAMTVRIYSILGQQKHETKLQSGVTTFSANSLGLSSGIYVVKIKSEGNNAIVKRLIVK